MSYFVTNTKAAQYHKEGDVWEESGKTWTMKNGVKKTLGKLDSFRKELVTPIACPSCGSAMKSEAHKPIWQVYKVCLNCLIKAEHEINKQGKWLEYQEMLMKANMESRYKDLEQFLSEYIHETTTHVTEDGAVENWVDTSKEVAEKVGAELLQNYKKEIEKLK
jgi:hypothetical protein